jgi:hypothetical protein
MDHPIPQSSEDDLLRKICMKMFPIEYRSKSSITRFHSRLPLEICQRIHQYRDLDDLHISIKKIKGILGFSNREKDKNRILHSLVSGTYRDDITESSFSQTYFDNDRHLLKMSLYMTLYSTNQSFPITNITTFEMARELVTCAWQAYLYLQDKFRDNRELATIAILQHVYAYDYMPSWLRLDREILRFILPRRDNVFHKLIEDLRSDEEMIRLALTRNYMNYRYLSEILQKETWVVELLPKTLVVFTMLHPVHHQDTKTILEFMKETIEIYFVLDLEQQHLPIFQDFYRECMRCEKQKELL